MIGSRTRRRRWIAGLALVAGLVGSASAAAQPRIWLEAPPQVDAPVRAGLLAERPELAFGEAEGADLSARIEAVDGQYVLRLVGADRDERRTLGPIQPPEPAVRLATLLILGALDDWRAPPAAPPPAPEAAPPPAPVATATRAAAEPREWLAVELQGAVVAWGSPLAPRIGLEAAAHTPLGPLRLGGRVAVAGLCCAVERDNVSVTSWLVAPMLEARLGVELGRFELEAGVGVGVAYESFSARVVDLFVGDAGIERRTTFGFVARVGGAARVDVTRALYVRAELGLQVHAREHEVRIPEAFSEGRTPLNRGRFLPTGGLGLGLRFF